MLYFTRFNFFKRLICGFCLVAIFSVFAPCLNSFALPVTKTFSFDLSNRGNVALSNGEIEVNSNKGYYSNFIDVSGYDSLKLDSFSYTLFALNNQNISDMNRLYFHYYDSSKKYISIQEYALSYSSWSDSGNSSYPYKAFYTFSDYSLSVPSSAKYLVVSLKNNGFSDNKANKWIVDSMSSVNMSYMYDDGSFNLNINTQPANVYYPLDGISVFYTNTYGDTVTPSTSVYSSYTFFEGDAIVDSFVPVTISGFKNSGYYDLDLDISFVLSPFSRSLSNGYSVADYGPSQERRELSVTYPTGYLESVPDGLNYSLRFSNLTNATAISYTRNAGSGSLPYVFKSNGDSTVTLNLYGTVYVDDKFTFYLHLPAFVSAKRFDVNAYNDMFRLLAFKLTPDISGVVQLSPYQSVSEIEALEKIEGAIDENTNEMVKEHEEEKNEANNASDELSSTLDSVTNTLSTVEILKLPWTMLQDLYNAVIADGEQILVFPSFSLMGYTLWDEYEFSLSSLDENFETLLKSLRLISGFLICFAFGHYIRSYFVCIFGGDKEVD